MTGHERLLSDMLVTNDFPMLCYDADRRQPTLLTG